jgi:hypothetical protein
MDHLGKIVLVGIALALAAGWLWRRSRAAQLRAQRQLARLQFADDRGQLEATFLEAAATTGKPRGLNWETCQLGEDQVFAVDRVSGELFALAGATISFSAIAGGDMEEVEAVGNLRYATAVFVHRQGGWKSDGQIVFNLEPAQAVERYAESLSPLA